MAKLSIKMLLASLSLLTMVGCSTTGDKSADVQEGTVSTSTGINADGTTTNALGEDSGFTKGTGSDLFSGVMHRSTLKVENQTYYFDFDKSDIQDIDRGSLEVQAKYLASHPSAKVLLEGHTDPRGSREYNIALGERRAKAVASALKLLGVEEAQIRIVSYGAEKLAAQGHSDEDYQLDRRVNLVYEAK